MKAVEKSTSKQSKINQKATPTINDKFVFSNGFEIKNRIVKSAMSEVLGTPDNRPTPKLARLYSTWASGGSGLLITGNVMIDSTALGEPNNVVIETSRDLESLREWASAAQESGTQCWVQLNHPGKQAPKGLNKKTVSPSAVPFKKEMKAFFDIPVELTELQIEYIIQKFGSAAKIVKEAGFSGVQIHGAHGYLVSQFLSPRHNIRTDKWGGSAINRRRFVTEVYRSIRAAVGDDFPIGIKLNSADFQRGGFTEEESLEVIKELEKQGVDLVEISGGSYEEPAMSGKGAKESTLQREAYFIEFAKKVRAEVSVPLVVTGGFRTQKGANDALASGDLDFVGLARPLAVDPNYANKLLENEPPKVKIKPIKTGISLIDKMGMMEVSWYTNQLLRMGKGKQPKPNEGGFIAFLRIMGRTGFRTFRKHRASS